MELNRPLPPGSTIGILGGGQLGRMLALAAARLGFRCQILAPAGDNPAFAVAATHTEAAYDDFKALEAFSAAVDVVTYEFENVPAATAGYIAERKPLAPSADALGIVQDRLTEKSFIADLDIAIADFAAVDGMDSLEWAINKIGRPAILKARRFGYDGKGQVAIRSGDHPTAAWAAVGMVPSILEGYVAFDKEISVIAARSWDGSTVVYDVPENRHENHVLRCSLVPAAISAGTAKAAQDIAYRIAAALNYVGVIGVEMFVTGDGGLMVNEIAPRVHNSGHWTIDACAISQFEQHIRAIACWPLGETRRHSDAVMTNLLGDEAGDWRALAAEPQTAVHLYGKNEARPGRKMGHVTRLSPRQA